MDWKNFLLFKSDFLQKTLWDNSLGQYLQTTIVIVAFFVFLKILAIFLNKTLIRLARNTKTKYDDVIIDIFSSIKPQFYIYLALYFSVTLFLKISEGIEMFMNTILWVWAVFYIISAGQKFIMFLTKDMLSRDGEQVDDKTTLQAISILVKIALWSIGLLLILSNLGVNITSLVAGLGIGGVAIAFALQNILSDLFSSFAIYFDKPFQVGDVIMIDGHIGEVEKIGIKTTRIKALQGEQIVMSNNHLTSATLQNFRKLEERRVVFNIGVTYDTDQNNLEKIPSIVGKIIDEVENVRFDRSHLFSLDDSSLTFENVYYVNSQDYQQYMDANQQILLKIKEAFDKEGIEFAFPTQTIHLEK